jgi:hypothetical protein
VRLPAATRFLLLPGVLVAAIYLAWDGGNGLEAPAPPPVGEGSAATTLVPSPPTGVGAGSGRPPLVNPHACYYSRLHAEDAPPLAPMLAVAEVLDEGLMNRDCGVRSQ